MKKKYLLYVIFPVLVMTLLIGSVALASTANTGKNNPLSTIASAIAKKFNLNVTEVQTVIDETMTAERAQMEKNRPNRTEPFAQAVKDGKLTQAQADLIIAKREEMKSDIQSMKEMTRTERETLVKTHRDTLKKWAIDNNIPEQYAMCVGGSGRGTRGERGFGRMGDNKANLPMPETSNSTN